MRKEYRKAVREQLTTGLRRLDSSFAEVKVVSPVLVSGESVFESSVCDGLTTFLLLFPSPTGQQAFTLEVGWSTEGRFPDVVARPSKILGPADPIPIHESEVILRIGDLAGTGDRWWQLPDPAVERPGDLQALQESIEPIDPGKAAETVAASVSEALELIAEVTLPFLSRLAAQHRDSESTGKGAS